MDLILRNARLADDAPLTDIAIAGGLIVDVSVDGGHSAPEEIDCAGRVVIPGLIESHLHLDKALLDREKPNRDGTLAGAIAVTGELKRDFTAENVRARASQVIEQAIGNGTTAIRAHPDVDPIVGLLGVDVLLGLREDYRGLVDLQIVAFPQEGIFKAPGTLELLREALQRGADVIGGCAYNENSLAECHAHIEAVFDLAEEFGVPADIHADFADDAADPRFALADYIAENTVRRRMAGRVALGHMTSLAGRPVAERRSTLARLADAGVAVVPLPATDLHLGGRSDGENVRRGVAPVRDLWEAGVTCAYSSNNVRNAFTPYGNADLLDIGLLLAQTSHLSGHADLARVLDMATHSAAKVVGISANYGIQPGCAANLVVLSTRCVADVLLDRPDRCFVIKNGRVVATTVRTTRLKEPSHA
ncbi:amidohydrolase family protein [Amycolatopsis alkalitolerans]|uniref:Amidohydrolase family protein n=1 Tax=Amycolatopsis alkalitolerans TaxID=2547244 RepID=A0A5C4LTX8_9PSEU|nr:amidohydrolase family protein [Amycolatopsis alkalitolerans]TNC21088.1 amidohydrolase family protein [Amycolatopsis alkalitolerans]